MKIPTLFQQVRCRSARRAVEGGGSRLRTWGPGALAGDPQVLAAARDVPRRRAGARGVHLGRGTGSRRGVGDGPASASRVGNAFAGGGVAICVESRRRALERDSGPGGRIRACRRVSASILGRPAPAPAPALDAEGPGRLVGRRGGSTGGARRREAARLRRVKRTRRSERDCFASIRTMRSQDPPAAVPWRYVHRFFLCSSTCMPASRAAGRRVAHDDPAAAGSAIFRVPRALPETPAYFTLPWSSGAFPARRGRD